jgi:hypothetical protein
VDDGIIISHIDCQLNALIDKLCACKIDFVMEEDYAGFLKVKSIITQTTDGTILMSQTDLIERILLDLGLAEVAKLQGNTRRTTEVLAPSNPARLS